MATDPNLEWLGHVQPVGLVVAPSVLARHGLNPEEQTRADSEAVRALLSEDESGPALPDPWTFFRDILGWQPAQVAGSPGGSELPADLSVRVEESDTDLAPHWAVTDPDGGWQLVVRIEAAGVGPEARGALEGWEATPHQRLERLLRESGVPTGLLITDEELRLVHAPSGETSGWLAFPLRSLAEVGGRPMLGGLKLILSSFRLHNDAPDQRLPALLRASRDAQAEVSARLASQVLGALHELLRGLHAADRERIEQLAATRQEHLYEGLLAVLLRLVFLLYAEDRELIPSRTDADARHLYEHYGVRPLYVRLLDDKAHHEHTMDERRGAWARLLALFRLVHRGDRSGWIRGRGGKLFDPAAFPFLTGQESPSDPAAPAPVSDGCVLRMLDLLLTLEGEKLSYRTLDVEQIGSVYETVMGFTIETRPGPALAIRAGKNDRTPVFVDLAALAATKGSERLKFLKEEADRRALTERVARPLAAATDQAGIVSALRPIVDERGTPGAHAVPPGTPLLQPTDERRRTGSHYTPRSLTEPIVRHALAPAFERIGPDARPGDILDLKICDPAMGSGAFLVEACRQIGERLVQSWTRWPETRPAIPPDEDDLLHAKRLVAQRCLYGVDRNPRAVDLAKLSLWLATLARDHEFTFLDHALKCGDSLVGLTKEQIAATHWDTSKPPTFVGKLVGDHLKEAEVGRARIRDHSEDATEAELRPLLAAVDAKLQVARLIGDAVVSAFFHADKPKKRVGRLVEVQKAIQSHLGSRDWIDAVAPYADELSRDKHPVRPFHWQIEFPEAFARENGGFDAIVGNPPFAGKNTIINGNRKNYLPWLQTLHEGAHGNADLVAHFFRRAFGFLRDGGVFGLIATNTIGQGDTRDTGLAAIIEESGAIARAVRRLKWPGEAAVVVSVVHVMKGTVRSPILDGRQVRRISAYLVEGDLDVSPARLVANRRVCFQGTNVVGMGFTFDDENASKGICASLATMKEIVSNHPECADRIKPFIGGEELNNDPEQHHRRFVIQFDDLPLETVERSWPELLKLVDQYVKPQRMLDKRDHRRKNWWQHGERQSGLYNAIGGRRQVIAASIVSPQFGLATLPSPMVYAHSLAIFCFDRLSPFASLQSRTHEVWARFFASSMKDDLRYTPSDCFETFPFAEGSETSPDLEAAGRIYYDYRATLMVARNEGMTKTYNHFHDPDERSGDIVRLRELHAEMDRVVLRAYGWDDLAARAEPIFLDETNEDDHTYQGRLFWPSAFRDEVLARLLALNAERAAEERAAGLVALAEDDADEAEEPDLADADSE